MTKVQTELRIGDLPQGAIGAAGAFHSQWIGRIEDALGGACEALAIILPAAAHDHSDWRRAAARDLARAHAPRRVNIVSGDDPDRVSGTISYLAGAPGITGQYLQTDLLPA